MDNTPTSTDDPSQPDLYWAGYSGFASLPGAILGGVLSAIVMFGAEELSEWTRLHDQWATFAAFWLVLAAWAAWILVWAYRSASFVYRLTPIRMYVDFGMFYPPIPPIELSKVKAVSLRSGPLRRLFGIGSVIIESEGAEPLRLNGIYQAERFLEAIEKARMR